MKKMGLHEIRQEFLEFFEEKEHLVVPSFSLVPKDDKSLLLIGAGMAPLKKYFTGEEEPKSKRMASCQKCIRTGDIENVGITDRHGTFFEMLGNFSFGNYFKKESIMWAWEFLTENLELEEDKLWITVYLDDDEAKNIWMEDIGVPEERILKLGKEDNFWELEVGPSGPCSEIHYDRGEAYACGSESCQPGCDCDRYLEIWNLVFTQFDKDAEGNYNPLPNPNIDTGMGLERIAALLEGVDSIFEIEAIRDILNEVENISGKSYGKEENVDISMRIITDHTRAMTFMVSDGIIPSNEGRGYVLRRLIRRASRHGKLLGVEGVFLGKIVDKVIDSWKVEYKDLEENREMIKEIIKQEEERFQETIDQGLEILESHIEDMLENKIKTLAGEKAFRLYDTYGFPLDLTREILEERKLLIDEEGFNEEMEKQRQRARAARTNDNVGWSASDGQEIYEGLENIFLGYDNTELESEVLFLTRENEAVDSLVESDKGVIVSKETCFYPEGGGQIGDSGFIITNNSARFKVLDTQTTNKGLIIHIGEVIEGEINKDSKLTLKPDLRRRNFISRNHTATHLLHRALKDVLGESVNQAGSIVEEDRLRFDFSYNKPVTDEELARIEAIVNEKIFDSLDVVTKISSLDEAREEGVVGLFEDQYDEDVRVLSIGDYSKELCGGIHVKNTSEIGLFKLISESSVASGVRRVEAITSRAAYNYIGQLEDRFSKIEGLLKANPNNLIDRVGSIVEQNKEMEKELESLRSKFASSIVDDIIDEKEVIDDIILVRRKVDNLDMNGLRDLSDNLKDKLESALIVLAGVKNDKVYFVVTASKDLVEKGIHAGNIIREVAAVTGGSGGGRPDMAQAGGRDASKVDEALEKAKSIVENLK